MTLTLTTVRNTRGMSKSFQLDREGTLTLVRGKLQEDGIMWGEADFLFKDSPVDRSAEGTTTLSEIIDADEDDTIFVGKVREKSLDDENALKYWQLTDTQKWEVLGGVGVLRGRTLRKEGLKKTFRDVCTWRELPAHNRPDVTTEKATTYRFSEVTSHLEVSGVQSGSVSLSVPFGEAKAEYEHEKKQSHDHKTVSERLVNRFVVRKVILKQYLEKMGPAAEFVEKVDKAATFEGSPTEDNYKDLVAVLDDWGFYVPTLFTLGGLVYATETTEITEFSQAETERKDFGASVSATFRGVGGGANYKQAEEKNSTKSGSNKYQNITLQSIGGMAISSHEDYTSWAESLDRPANWAINEYAELLPSLVLLKDCGDKVRYALQNAMLVLQQFSGREYNYLHIGKYVNKVQSLVQP
ncbi:MAC/perforin domain-containing protein [Actinosynnema sp. CA-299493]